MRHLLCGAALGAAALFVPMSAGADEPKPDPGPLADETFIPLQRGSWIAGFSGSIGRAEETISPRDATDLAVRTSGFRWLASTRNGYFLRKRFVIGLDFQLSVTNTTTSVTTGGNTLAVSSYDERLFLGPWLRYYIPISEAWAIFPEFSWGFLTRYHREDTSATPVPEDEEDRSSGLSFNLGFGFTYFLSRHVGFDVTGRYSRGKLRGRYTSLRARNDLDDLAVLIGLQVYLPEFSF